MCSYCTDGTFDALSGLNMQHLKHMKGDLLQLAREGHFNVIVQGCNCFCTMGSGIAKQIKEEYPEAYAADCETVKGDKSKLGSFTVAHVEQFDIINAYTQYDYNRYGQPKADHFEYDNFALILLKLAEKYKGCNFGFPCIGMGLAGGDVVEILFLLETFADIVQYNGGSVTLVEYQKEN
jgi:O-acetyl-ADP-ribose deacetylase (regulator of RNase III)